MHGGINLPYIPVNVTPVVNLLYPFMLRILVSLFIATNAGGAIIGTQNRMDETMIFPNHFFYNFEN